MWSYFLLSLLSVHVVLLFAQRAWSYFAQTDFHILFHAMSHPRKNRQTEKEVCVCVWGGGVEGIEWVRLS